MISNRSKLFYTTEPDYFYISPANIKIISTGYLRQELRNFAPWK